MAITSPKAHSSFLTHGEYAVHCASVKHLSIGHHRAMTRDTRHYPDPEEFKPERYLKDGKLNPEVLDPGDFGFGYGRRSVQ